MDILSNFSERLIELMKENDLNAEKLAKALNIEPTVVRRWCLPNKDAFISSLIKLAEYFECSLDYLCKRSDTFLDYKPKECPPFMEWLPTVIKERGKTTYQIFTQTRIKSSYFTSWRQGSEPLISSLGVLADFLDVSLDHLIGRDR